MPLYEYVCLHCGHAFERLRRMRDADAELQCPECDSKKVERILSAFSAGKCGSSKPGFG